MKGIIARVIGEKGFGFLRGEDGVDYFFHQSDFNGFFNDLAGDIAQRRKIQVTFEIAESTKGPRAREVTRTDGGVMDPTD